MALHLRKCRIAIATALVTPLLTPLPATAARASTAQRAASCTARSDPALAAQLSRDIRAVLAARRGTVSVAVHDPGTGLNCALADRQRYDTASIAKVMIMEAALRRAQDWRRGLTAWERGRIRPMIIRSDNTAARRLWDDLGMSYIARYLRRAGTTDTTLNPYGFWGLTRTTAADQLRLLGVLTTARATSLLSPASRAYGLKQLNEVRRDQRWGVPAGMPRGTKAHLKNGWLPRSTHGWRVHSVGAFTAAESAGRTYRIVVLSHDNPTMKYGVRTIERVAQAVHRALNKGRAAGQWLTPEGEISEVPDGSAPPESQFEVPPEATPEAPPEAPPEQDSANR
ncbi:class A beta-lactamase-related serine hydrolase [Streptomyces sp. NBC_01381]|uniref:serine hydrolase n=1 Tax=Streptomyces sp. NBC_01381 TaxID=2903845 RepID=UPI0022553672|nr:serine hydrolase [Streptomyces sp. NBC_01381]MCX4667930.1 class A beta-lactamase-related serine hydrolase [Streptomyces sp. NBC_01381]